MVKVSIAKVNPADFFDVIAQRDTAIAERDAARKHAAEIKQDVIQAEKYAESLAETVQDQRKTIDDLRRQRDNAQKEATALLSEFSAKERDLYRAIGWIDAKMDKAPGLVTVFSPDPDTVHLNSIRDRMGRS